MFGSHFYHATVRKSVAVFGTLFNNITVARKKGDGSLINQVKVPLAYGPKQKFLSRLDTETGQDASTAIKLPRMAFEISSIEQDTNKKLQKRVSIDEPTATTVVTGSTTTRTQITDFTDATHTYALTNGVKTVSSGFGFGSLNDTYSAGFNPNTAYLFNTFNNEDSDAAEKPYKILFVIARDFTENGDGNGTTLPVENRSSFFGQSLHPTINGALDPTTTVLSYGGVDLAVADAEVTDGFIFSSPAYRYTWKLTQTQMDTIYDNKPGGAGTGTGTVVMSWDTIVTTPTTAVSSRKSIRQQSPYNINMQLNIMAKNQDDGLQILEQIIPYFQPEYTVAIKPIDDMTSFKQDVPIILNSVSFDDQYEGDYNSRRVLIYTLDFQMKMTFYGPLTEPKVIRQVLIDFTEERKFGAAITLLSAIKYPTFFVPGATIYQGSDKNRTWSGTIDSLESTVIRLVENNTTGYTAGGPLFVNNNGEIQKYDATGNTIALSADLNTLSSMDIKIGDTDTESDFTVTTTIDNTDFS
jgi:hypothetical protein